VSTAADAVAAVRAGAPVVLAFDTVYGLAADPHSEDAARRLYRLKGAVVARDVDHLIECVPELHGDAERVLRALLPGPYTFVLPNPARRFRWLTGANPEALGIRVPTLAGAAAEVLSAVGALAATSANHPGGRDPSALDEVPEDLRTGAGAAVDGGRLAGVPSTVVDLTGAEPRVLREGVVPAAEVLGRLGAPVRSP
jgi:L-threonylcarbamoyladenylate synthase